MTAPTRLALNINDACAALGIGRTNLYELLASGEIKAVLLGGRRVIPVSEMERYLKRALAANTTGWQPSLQGRAAPSRIKHARKQGAST